MRKRRVITERVLQVAERDSQDVAAISWLTLAFTRHLAAFCLLVLSISPYHLGLIQNTGTLRAKLQPSEHDLRQHTRSCLEPFMHHTSLASNTLDLGRATSHPQQDCVHVFGCGHRCTEPARERSTFGCSSMEGLGKLKQIWRRMAAVLNFGWLLLNCQHDG